MDSEGYVSAAEQLRKNLGLTEEEFLNVMKETIKRLKGVHSDHIIDLDAPPYIPNGLSVVEHRQGGQMVWDPTKVKFHISKNQKGGKRIEGNKLRKELEGKPVYNANLLDYLYANQELIPEEWKKNEDGSIRFTYFWGTIYRASLGSLDVRYLCFSGGQWCWSCSWLGSDWDGRSPAAVPAS